MTAAAAAAAATAFFPATRGVGGFAEEGNVVAWWGVGGEISSAEEVGGEIGEDWESC